MLVIKIDALRPSARLLQNVAAVIRQGGVVIYPTDTAYAVGGRYDSASVVRRVLEIKGRRDRKFTLVAASLEQVLRHFRLHPMARRLARRHWPGPLSIVVSPRFAVRVPDLAVARDLVRFAGAPLIATSANRSGGKTPYSVRSVVRQLGHRADLILDAGRLPKRKPSTIVRVDGHGVVKVIRAGAFKPSVKLPVIR